MNKTELIDKYPRFFEKLAWGIECYDGWLVLLDELIEKILSIYSAAQATQIKEKYGELRVYMLDTTNEVENLIDEYTDKSRNTCEICGGAGKVRVRGGWYRARCDDCMKEIGGWDGY